MRGVDQRVEIGPMLNTGAYLGGGITLVGGCFLNQQYLVVMTNDPFLIVVTFLPRDFHRA